MIGHGFCFLFKCILLITFLVLLISKISSMYLLPLFVSLFSSFYFSLPILFFQYLFSLFLFSYYGFVHFFSLYLFSAVIAGVASKNILSQFRNLSFSSRK